LPCRGRVRVPPGRHGRLDEPRHRLPRPRQVPTHRWTHNRCRQRSPSGRMVRAYAAIGRRRHGLLCCRRANGALRFVLTIDYGPSLPPTEIITRVLIDPILTRWGASERLPRGENQCAVRLQLVSGLVRIAEQPYRRRDILGSDRQRARRVRSTVLRGGVRVSSALIAPAGLVGVANWCAG
jgi:hypothetical protein